MKTEPVIVTNTATPYEIRAISYEVPSASSTGVTYRVSVDAGGWRCTCPGWKYRGTCRHLRAARAGEAGKPRIAIMPLPSRPQPPCTCMWGDCPRHDPAPTGGVA
jgi:hypothetical protein